MRELFSDPEPTGYVRVAVERAVDAYPSGLVYGIPPELPHLCPGVRVHVPLGRGQKLVAGTVVDRLKDLSEEGIPPEKVRNIVKQDTSMEALPGELIELARWMSAYYACPIGMTLAGIIPSAVKKGAGRTTRHLLRPAPIPEDQPRLGRRQKEVLELLRSLPESELPIDLVTLAERAELSSKASIKRLIELGLVESERVSAVEAKWRSREPAEDRTVTPNDDQSKAIANISSTLRNGFSTHLLFGVTGAGKTEVYLRVIKDLLEHDRTALFLVPEIALAAQTVARVLARFPGVPAAVLHSGLTAAQRNQAWERISTGEAKLVLGARSALFAPIPDGQLGAIFVDEEHDSAFKQDQAPRYHGRDAAIRRAQIAGCPIILGSATPSLESWHNATSGRTQLHRLPKRAPGLSLPKVDIVDFAEERRNFGSNAMAGIRVIGPRLAHAINTTLYQDGQVLLLLNRRGYANYIACPDHRCGWILTCDQCDAGMICHQDTRDGQRERWVRCHHCGSEQKLTRSCPQCSKRVTVFGQGTQRVEEEILRLHPSLTRDDSLVRVDSDTMKGTEQFDEVLERFRSGRIRLLCGTQMIAKGLDFPGVRLVGVVNADTAINLPDFRSSERTFQLVSQVVGRCGRGTEAGHAIIQTFQPDHPAIQTAAEHDFETFAQQELSDRIGFGLPPSTRMARILVRDAGERNAWKLAETLAARLETHATAAGAEIRPPAACPIARIAGRYRIQLEVVGPTPACVSSLLTMARNSGVFAGPLALGEAVAIDVDPVAML